MHPITNIAIQAARQAGDLIMRYYERLETKQISEKTAHDFVTEIDKLAEQEIINIIRDAYPEHAVLGEEGGSDGDANAEYTWIIDPIDGTLNYIHGVPYFSVSIGVKHKGIIENAVIYDPLQQELFYATRGDGAYLNSHRIRVSQRTSLKDAVLITGIPYKKRETLPLFNEFIAAVFPQVSGLRSFGSAALHLAYVACGRVDGCWIFYASPWDIAAGILLVKEAGGLVGDFAGEEKYMESGCVVAAPPKVFKELVKAFKPRYEKLLVKG